MSAMGLVMLVVLSLCSLMTTLPFWVALVGVSSAFAALGIATGAFQFELLTIFPLRISGLLESDLLQALPLYVLVGALLLRLRLIDSMFELFQRGFARFGASAQTNVSLAMLSTACIVAPMNGSVASREALIYSNDWELLAMNWVRRG